jgi:predicted DNA-binding protein YlxM (UPF0122 family)
MPEHAVWLAHYRKYLSLRRIAESFSISVYPDYIKKTSKMNERLNVFRPGGQCRFRITIKYI